MLTNVNNPEPNFNYYQYKGLVYAMKYGINFLHSFYDVVIFSVSRHESTPYPIP